MQKGGVAKSETSQNTADALAWDGLNVLVIDYDPQGSITDTLALRRAPLSLTEAMFMPGTIPTAELMVGSEHNTGLSGSVTYIPRAMDSLTLETRLTTGRAREYRLARILDQIEEQHPGRFDRTIIDCPSYLGAVTDAALVAARYMPGYSNGILVPVLAEAFCVKAMPFLLEQINAIQDALGINIHLHGMTINRFNETKGNAVKSYHAALSALPIDLIHTVRERTATMQDAELAGTTGFMYAPESDLADSFRAIGRALSAGAAA